MEDLTSLNHFRTELADLLRRVDDRIAEEERRRRLTPDEVRLKKLENAVTYGANLARADIFSTADSGDELRRLLSDEYNGDQQLIEQAMTGARRTWREVAA